MKLAIPPHFAIAAGSLADQRPLASSIALVMRQAMTPISEINRDASNIEISFIAHTPRFACAVFRKTDAIVVPSRERRSGELRGSHQLRWCFANGVRGEAPSQKERGG
jgi:hypothetical protein